MSADSHRTGAGSGHRPPRSCATLLTGSVASIAFTFIVVVAVGLSWVGPNFLSFGNVTIIGTFLVVPLIVGAFAGLCAARRRRRSLDRLDASASQLGASSRLLLAMGWPLAGGRGR